MKIVIASITIALALALPAGISNAGNAHAAAIACSANQLKVSLAGINAGVGNAGAMLKVTNKSKTACTVKGYPALKLLNAGKKTMASHISHGSGYLFKKRPVTTVSLRPGASAYFVVEWSPVPSGTSACPSSSYLSFALPGSSKPITIPIGKWKMMACGGKLVVSAFSGSKFSGFSLP
jgi:hypothetical protein